MFLKPNEYKIENDGIWISRKALERERDRYREIANEHQQDTKADIDTALYYGYHGKADSLIEILKMFNKEIFY